jgi:hypothetical protein
MKSLNNFASLEIASTDEVKGGTSNCYCAPKSAPVVNIPKFETPKYEIPKYEIPKYEIPKYEIPKYEIPKYETPKIKVSSYHGWGC